MNRRRALLQLGALLGAPMAAAAWARKHKDRRTTVEAKLSPRAEPTTMPVIFVAHGAPPLLDDAEWMSELGGWATQIPRPRAIVVVSAHWEAKPIALAATTAVPLVYDFYGFPERYYEIQYPAPGAPAVASRVRELLTGHGLPYLDEPKRGLDHGSYVPLMAMYPAADVPVLQVSLPGLAPHDLAACGHALAALREEQVLVMGSGFLTHNLRMLGEPKTPTWASEFDAWAGEVLATRDLDALMDFERRAPAARRAHPRTEHFAPIIVSLAAASERNAPVTFPITGWWKMAPAFTRRSVQFG